MDILNEASICNELAAAKKASAIYDEFLTGRRKMECPEPCFSLQVCPSLIKKKSS